jgi:signal transduction histidine kinase
MKASSETWNKSDILISVVVFVFLLVFTYGLLFLIPYSGFYFNPTNGEVRAIFEDLAPASVPHLMEGDILKRLGPISFEEYRNSATVNFFQNYQPGDVVDILIERDGESITVPWVYAGFNDAEFEAHFFNVWWLAYIFWIIGTATQIFMRPRDKRWMLFVAFNYLTGMFIMLGTVSSFQFLASPLLMRAVAWLMLPVYLHFHWIFPHSLRPIPGWAKSIFYVVCGGFAITQLFSTTLSPLYFFAIILAFGGSILLLAAHYVFQPQYRREVSILAVAALVSLGFTTVVGIVSAGGQTPSQAVLALLALPILPGTYFYVLYRNNLGGLELRTNRAITLYAFMVLFGTVLMLAVSYSGLIDIPPQAFLFATVLVALSAMFIGVQVFPAFQSFVERRVFGIKLPAQSMVENFSDRIVTSTTLPGLLKLLEEDVFPSLLVRQYVFAQAGDTSIKIPLSQNVDLAGMSEEALKDFLASAPNGRLIPLSTGDPRFRWVRLLLPLKIGKELIGAWLLGRRDPDDHYPQAELPILQSLANQTAIALSYIVQTERLKLMYEANINRYEQEHLRLGHELHDSLLNEMAAMLMKHDPDALPKEFQESFDGLIVRLREIVTDLRPPLLTYGLKSALDGLADNLSERNHDVVKILSTIQSVDECRYPQSVEHNIYRVVQEACENALKYARAKSIQITGALSPGTIELQISDDGVGFKDGVSLRLDEMIANKHYGLAGMHERAELIEAIIRIDSQIDKGTHIQVFWHAKDTI